MKTDGQANGKPSSEDARIMAFLTSSDQSEAEESKTEPRRAKAADSTRPKRQRAKKQEYPVETRNRYDGTHEGIRERALAEAIKLGINPANVRATGPNSFEFIVDD